MIVVRTLAELITELERARRQEERAQARTQIDDARRQGREWAYGDALRLIKIYQETVESEANKEQSNAAGIYSRDECPFNYCDNPEVCKSLNRCHYA